LVVSNDIFNKFSKLAMVCPVTNTNKKYPFHIELDARTKTQGAILCAQARILDIAARNARYIEKAPDDVLSQVTELLVSFIEVA